MILGPTAKWTSLEFSIHADHNGALYLIPTPRYLAYSVVSVFSPGFLHRAGGGGGEEEGENKVYGLSVHVPALFLCFLPCCLQTENNRLTMVDAELSYTGMYH